MTDGVIRVLRHVIDRAVLLAILYFTASNFDSTELMTWGLMIVFGGGADGALNILAKRLK